MWFLRLWGHSLAGLFVFLVIVFASYGGWAAWRDYGAWANFEVLDAVADTHRLEFTSLERKPVSHVQCYVFSGLPRCPLEAELVDRPYDLNLETLIPFARMSLKLQGRLQDGEQSEQAKRKILVVEPNADPVLYFPVRLPNGGSGYRPVVLRDVELAFK